MAVHIYNLTPGKAEVGTSHPTSTCRPKLKSLHAIPGTVNCEDRDCTCVSQGTALLQCHLSPSQLPSFQKTTLALGSKDSEENLRPLGVATLATSCHHLSRTSCGMVGISQVHALVFLFGGHGCYQTEKVTSPGQCHTSSGQPDRSRCFQENGRSKDVLCTRTKSSRWMESSCTTNVH